MTATDPIEFLIKDWTARALQYEERAALRRAQADDIQAIAAGCDTIARHYRWILGQLTGQPQPLAKSDIRAGETDLGLKVGPGLYAPPPGATDEEINEFVDAMDELATSAIHQRKLGQDEQGRRWRAVERTGELDLREVVQDAGPPAADPLTASPADAETQALPAAGEARPGGWPDSALTQFADTARKPPYMPRPAAAPGGEDTPQHLRRVRDGLESLPAAVCPLCSAQVPGPHEPGCTRSLRVAAAMDGQGAARADALPGGDPAAGRFQGSGPDRSGAVDGGGGAAADGPASGDAGQAHAAAPDEQGGGSR